MKNYSLGIGVCLCVAMVVISCSTTNESIYKAAYEQAKYQETVRQTQNKLANKGKSKKSSSEGKCWSCHGTGRLMGAHCPSCGGSGTMNVSFNYDPNARPVYPGAGGTVSGSGTVGSGTTADGGSTPSSSHQCRVCNGTGSEIYEPYTGSGRSVYCNICRRNFSHAHAHRTCKTCNGTGRVSY